jgi:addiction module HigA family antidote
MKFKRFSSPFHPGEILLEEFLQPLGLSQRAFAEKIGWSPRKLNEIIRGKRSVTAASAIELAESLKTTPEFWLNLQQMWDLDLALKERKIA